MESTVFEALDRPLSAINLEVTRALVRLRPGMHLAAIELSAFDVDDFARGGHCTLTPLPNAPSHARLYPDERNERLLSFWMQAWRRVEWDGQQLEVVTVTWGSDTTPDTFSWVLAPSQELAHRFILAVCAFDELATHRVLVFENGHFKKSALLSDSLKGVGFDALVLAGSLAEELRSDAKRFFGRRAFYEEHGLPWKRGLLFVGPPGNGKTQTIKALLAELGRPVLYVKSFHSRCTTEENIRQVFQRARRAAPAVLVLEDLDCLIDEHCRSVFLNELDGFAQNTGLLVIATTNHPEKLDRSILDRPSRFDRKFHFPLPGDAERRAYLEKWSAAATAPMRLSAEALASLTQRTRGFTFAYLKELVLSASLRWADDAAPGAMDRLATQVATELVEQMASTAAVLGPLERSKTIGFAEYS